jgi:4-amino-4-deoxychorismate lyase
MATWINGELRDQIATSDRALNYGEGIFTTILIRHGQCCDLLAHLARLQHGIKSLIMSQIDYAALATQLEAIAKNSANNSAENQGLAVIKVLVSRGSGLRGYSSIGCDSPQIIVTLSNYPAHYLQLQQQGIALGVSTIPLGLNPLLAGIKHLNRLEQVLVRQQIDHEQWSDALVLDCQGFIVETSVANIFWVKDNIVYTPSLELAGVRGIMRDKVITWLTSEGYQIESDRYRLGSIIDADEVFMTNCLMTAVRVNSIEETIYQDHQVFDYVRAKINDV